MGDIIKTGLKLFLITSVAALALGLANAATAPRIEEQARLSRIEAKSEVLPQTLEFVKVDIEDLIEAHPMIIEVHEGNTNASITGYTFRVRSSGFAEMELYIGVTIDGAISGVKVVYQRETPGLGTRAMHQDFTGQFLGLSATNAFALVKGTPVGDQIQAISGATTSSYGVVRAINAAIELFAVLAERG